MQKADGFVVSELEGVYRAIRERRDVRSGFLPERMNDELLLKLLQAAHYAPSVGLMQPWRFILIRRIEIRRAVYEIFQRANQAALSSYEPERAEKYAKLKLEGILDAPQNLCVVCDPEATRGHRLGRRSMPETAIYSTVCAVQNLWLAARAEGIGVGWVSILDPAALREVLHIPEHIVPVAYLCLGYVDRFASEPDLVRSGWESRIPVEEAINFEQFDSPWTPEGMRV